MRDEDGCLVAIFITILVMGMWCFGISCGINYMREKAVEQGYAERVFVNEAKDETEWRWKENK